MPWNGSSPNQTFGRNTGVFTGATAWAQTDGAARGIRTDDHDTHDQDIADAISLCLKKDGGNTASANIPMGGFKLTGLAAGSTAGDSVRFEQLESGVLTTRGDMLFRNASSPARLAKGTNGQFLKIGANDPAWASIANTDVSGLGTASTVNTGTSGATVPLLNAGNTFSALTSFTAGIIGTSTAVASGTFTRTGSVPQDSVLELKRADTDGLNGLSYVHFRDATGSVRGSITAATGGSVVYNTTSGRDLKENIDDLDGFRERIRALRPRKFRWKEGGVDARGFVAEEVAEVYPGSVTPAGGEDTPAQTAIITLEEKADMVAMILDLDRRLDAAGFA